jgi:hypothetical protein
MSASGNPASASEQMKKASASTDENQEQLETVRTFVELAIAGLPEGANVSLSASGHVDANNTSLNISLNTNKGQA